GDETPLLTRLEAQLSEYFAGERTEFDLPLNPKGTPFMKAVWARLSGIPYGQTTSYGRLAADAGMPRAARAVGAAVGRNPITLVVPCHRVLGVRGAMTGYSGGEERKRALLELELKRAAR
ncbi:MAG TPA: methylated-DNA--[protein]-cysteine S-methyltransferase, partial [Candidatus Limnocylindria bacterium]|nr:methylated-DNA--[protein]-cysteine S-methyltransferase [Candidatus Limnocylindria bacterium]